MTTRTFEARLSRIEAAEEERYRTRRAQLERRRPAALANLLKGFPEGPTEPQARACEVLADWALEMFARHRESDYVAQMDAAFGSEVETEETLRGYDGASRRLHAVPADRLDRYLSGLSGPELLMSITPSVRAYFERLDREAE